jgi:hypothetical protein
MVCKYRIWILTLRHLQQSTFPLAFTTLNADHHQLLSFNSITNVILSTHIWHMVITNKSYPKWVWCCTLVALGYWNISPRCSPTTTSTPFSFSSHYITSAHVLLPHCATICYKGLFTSRVIYQSIRIPGHVSPITTLTPLLFSSPVLHSMCSPSRSTTIHHKNLLRVR